MVFDSGDGIGLALTWSLRILNVRLPALPNFLLVACSVQLLALVAALLGSPLPCPAGVQSPYNASRDPWKVRQTGNRGVWYLELIAVSQC